MELSFMSALGIAVFVIVTGVVCYGAGFQAGDEKGFEVAKAYYLKRIADLESSKTPAKTTKTPTQRKPRTVKLDKK